MELNGRRMFLRGEFSCFFLQFIFQFFEGGDDFVDIQGFSEEGEGAGLEGDGFDAFILVAGDDEDGGVFFFLWIALMTSVPFILGKW